MKQPVSILLCLCLLLGQCKVNKNSTTTNEKAKNQKQVIVKDVQKNNMQYRAAETKLFDLQHTRLELAFNYEKEQVLGKAHIRLKPHFYPSDSLILDATQFMVHRVAKVEKKDTINLPYSYNLETLRIFLGRTYSASETVEIFIDYTARPSESKKESSQAISDAKGLYFINASGKDPDKPRQIWSQGETQSNSCWFPTLDVPNQKMTQEISLTVDKKDITLSNGELILSKDNPDGTRTDYWKQSLPHAPYLTMIAIGQFVMMKDYWRDNMEVNYYVEPQFKPYAKLIFGNTPEMLEFFSKKLGVDYPWEKFSQIVVRDFVSGAMENTSAVIHFELLQHDAREHLDNTYEDVISHELFHHWFGDLVTCESWSNIPLNESFATYGEYLWNDYKYGRMFADKELDDKLNAYLLGGNNRNKIPIRYRYNHIEDMFDAVSYQKGGRILHMLRYTVGDSAFFRSLQLYLTEHKFGTAEIHDLRQAFEQVTGQDLNWFFNQWFLKAGHPTIQINYKKAVDGKSVTVQINQTQDSAKLGIYQLPVDIDIYSNNKVKRNKVTLTKSKEEFTFHSDQNIQLVNVDANKVLVAEITDNKTKEVLTYQFLHAPLYADKWFALKGYTGNTDSIAVADSNLLVMADYALQHTFAGIRKIGVEILQGATRQQMMVYEFRLRNLAKNDSSSLVRTEVINLLKNYDAYAFENLFEEKLQDSSYQVASSALLGLQKADAKKAIKLAAAFESSTNGTMLSSVSTVYAASGDTAKYSFFIPAMRKSGPYKYNILQDYWEYTMMQMPTLQLICLKDIYSQTQLDEKDVYLKYINSQLSAQMLKQNEELKSVLENALKKQKPGTDQHQNISKAITDLNEVNKRLVAFGEK